MFKSRKYNKLLKNIGTVTEKDSYITIEVDNEVLKKMLKLSDNVLIIKSNYLKDKSNKKIIYNINNMNFDGVSIHTDESVCFKDCNFINGTNIIKADSLLFNHSNFISEKDEYDDNFFTGKNINSIIFYDENITDQNVAFRIEAKTIDLHDTVLLKDNGHTNFKCNKFSMNNSTIGGETSFIEAKKMYIVDQSKINNKKNCFIECDNINGSSTFIAPRTILNGKLYENKNNKIKDYH